MYGCGLIEVANRVLVVGCLEHGKEASGCIVASFKLSFV